MTKTLKDILAMQPKTHDYTSKKIEGVHKSTTTDDLTGDDPGVDYESKSKAGNDFVKLHKVQKWEDRNGNGDDVFNGKTKPAIKNSENTRMGRKSNKESEAVYESVQEKVKRALGSRYTQDMEIID